MFSDARTSSEAGRFSGPRTVRPLGLVLALALLLAAGAGLGCGKRGDPMPPIRLMAAPVDDLVVTQRGDLAYLTFPYPRQTAAGTPLPGLEAVEVRALVAGLADGAERPEPADPRQFRLGAETVLRLEGPELAAAVRGDRLVVPVEVPTPPADAEAGDRWSVTWSVRTAARGGETSADSTLVAQEILTAPPRPRDLEAEGRRPGVLVGWTWEPPEDADPASSPDDAPAEDGAGSEAPESGDEEVDGETETEADADDGPGIVGFHVYRRDAVNRLYGEPVGRLPAVARRFVDRTAVEGERYIYTVTTVASRRPVLVESALAGEVEVLYRDTFPPEIPTELVALPEGDRVRLVWTAVDEDDVAGYRIYRRGPAGGPFELAFEVGADVTEAVEENLTPGPWRWRITAFDDRGNESRPTTPVLAEVR